MARTDVYLNINASDPADAVVLAQQTLTATDFPTLVLGDTPSFNFYFTDGTASWPSFAGDGSYSVTWALSDSIANDNPPYALQTASTPLTGGWAIRLPLNTGALINACAARRVSQSWPVVQLWQHIRVTDPSGYVVSYALVRTNVRLRAISDTQQTPDDPLPAGEQFVLANEANELSSPSNLTFAGNLEDRLITNGSAIDALGAVSTSGIIARTGASTYSARTLTGTTPITVTNGNGVSGNPTVSVDLSSKADIDSPNFTGTPTAATTSFDSAEDIATRESGDSRWIQTDTAMARRGKASYYLDGSTGYISGSAAAFAPGTGDATFVWIGIPYEDGWLFTTRATNTTSNGVGIQIKPSDSTMLTRVTDGTTFAGNTSIGVNLKSGPMVAVLVIDSATDTATTYLDGAAVDTVSLAALGSIGQAQALYIGRDNAGYNAQQFFGFAYLTDALTSDEVAAISRYPASLMRNSALLCYMEPDVSTFLEVSDLSGNGNHGTINAVDTGTYLDNLTASRRPKRNITTGTYTLVERDNGNAVYVSTATCTITIPSTLSRGFWCEIIYVTGGGTITLSATTLRAAAGKSTITTQYDVRRVIHDGSGIVYAY